MSSTFDCSVVTPERAVLETAATFAALPGWDGEIGFQPGRAPLLVKLAPGELRVEGPDGKHRFFIDGGFAQMVDDRLTVLTEGAVPADDIDADAAAASAEEARALPALSDAEFTARQRALQAARAQRRMAGRAERR